MAGRVAVIAVHGVGSPPRDETARAVAELLMHHAPADVRYEWNEERRLTIETSPVSAGPARERGSLSQQFLRAFTPRAGDRTKLDATKETAERPDIAFMRELLRDYHSVHEPYQTIETVGVRHGSGGDTEVHVFEMHWADLSRLGSGLVRLVGAAYQLVQHISQLGRKNWTSPRRWRERGRNSSSRRTSRVPMPDRTGRGPRTGGCTAGRFASSPCSCPSPQC